jgi:4,5-dihydroxyphthalate decarboxylase
MANVKLTIAIKHYDRHLPLLQGKVGVEGVDANFVTVTSPDRYHDRMLATREWDVSELSLSGYLMARSNGFPLVAIPIFPRRLFSQSQLYVNTNAGVSHPQDLRGKRIGLAGGYTQSLSVLAKGDLQDYYGVALDQVTWISAADKEGSRKFKLPASVRLEKASRNLEEMLADGDIDALAASMIPRAFLSGVPQVARLFTDSHAEEMAYFRKTGNYPIMHVLAAKSEIIAEHPWVAKNLFRAFEQAKTIAYHYYDDPNWSHLSGIPALVREHETVMGENRWPNGIASNKQYLERFMRYQVEQGLIERVLTMNEVFAETTLDT